MTLSIMENHDVIKAALKDYQKGSGEIPKVLERYLEYVARTGKPLFSWDLISCLVMRKFENVLDDFVMEKPIICMKNVNGDNMSAQDLKHECIQALNSLTGVPFTIQRVCELLLSPKKNYSKLEKFLRGFLRVVKVVTTVDRIGQKITTESQLFANAMSPFGSGDNSWSGFSSQSEDSMNMQMHNAADNLSELESKHEMDYTDVKASQPVSVCLPADSMESYSSKMIDQEQQTSENMYGSESYYQEQNKTISMPPIRELFKPIDQLEAFVQNVSNQVESSSTKNEESKKRPSSDEICLPIDDKNLSSSDDVQEYVSPAKKRKLDFVSQDSVISSSDVSSDNEQQSSQIDEGDITDNDATNNTMEIEAMETVSSHDSICAEEPSSTNEIKDDDETKTVEDDIKPDLVNSVESVDEVDLCATASSVEGSIDGDVCATADAGNSVNHQAVEADQSNCDDVDREEDDANKDESLSSSSVCIDKDSSSIDEETGEHV